jgi:NAD dependent epimerase/dehydratase family enzyme
MRGPYNAAAPNPVTNAEFGRAIARTLGRPAWMRYPVPVLKIIIGEAGKYASGGPRVRVEKVRDAGYRFFFSNLDEALSSELAG